MPLTFSVTTASPTASEVRLGRHTLRFDQPASHGGGGTGPSPLVVFASASAACAHYFLAQFLNAREIDSTDLVVDVTMAKAEEGIPRLGTLDLLVKLPAGVPQKYAKAIQKIIRQCPVHGTLHTPPEVGLEVIFPD
jgi:putative redox protein